MPFFAFRGALVLAGLVLLGLPPAEATLTAAGSVGTVPAVRRPVDELYARRAPYTELNGELPLALLMWF